MEPVWKRNFFACGNSRTVTLGFRASSEILAVIGGPVNTQMANKPENRSQRPWIITMSHRPMYCASSLGECTRRKSKHRNGINKSGKFGLEELFHKYNVDIEFAAHKHVYERWWPVYKQKIYKGSATEPYTNPKALVHIITGVPGSIFGPDIEVDDHPWTAFRSTDFGYTRLHIFNKTHLYLEQIAAEKNGEVVDKMMLIKDAKKNTKENAKLESKI